MQELKDRIVREGRNLGGGILRVDSFINHQVDPGLMDLCGQEFARRFASVNATRVLTAEISGIAPALICSASSNPAFTNPRHPATVPRPNRGEPPGSIRKLRGWNSSSPMPRKASSP